MVINKKENNKEAEEKQEEKSDLIFKLRKNPYIVSTLVFGLVVLILLVIVFKPGLTGNVISLQDAENKVLDFAKSRGIDLSLVKVNDKGSLYEVVVLIRGEQIPVYITKDGEFLVSGITPLTASVIEEEQEQPKAEVPKSDKPRIELFVMTYCPYGLQAEKGIIPVLKLLGNKIDSKIRFVRYFMHGDEEEQETYNQLCIREEQSSKFLGYLECFLEDGNSERCLTKIVIDKAKLNACLSGNAKEYYKKDSELSQSYGVQGSPTLIVNSIEASSGRSPSAFLSTICSAFNTKPSECQQQLSTENPSPGFGYTSSGSSSSGGSC